MANRTTPPALHPHPRPLPAGRVAAGGEGGCAPPPGPTTAPTPPPTSRRSSARSSPGPHPGAAQPPVCPSTERGCRKTISGGRTGLAPKTVRNVHLMLHSALHDAMRWGYLVRNVAVAADPPAARSPEQEGLVTPRSWAPRPCPRRPPVRPVAAGRHHRHAPRRTRGLRWVDIDFDHATVSPTIPRVVVDHRVHDSAPKTERPTPRPGSSHPRGTTRPTPTPG